MKKILATLCLVCALRAESQTFVNYYFTNFTYNGVDYSQTVTVNMPTNTVATMLNYQYNANISSGVVTVQYPGQSVLTFPSSSQWINVPLLGPATVTVTAYSSSSSGNLAVVLVRFDVVNQSTSASAVTIQPGGTSAAVNLQVSTNLTTWTTTQNSTNTATGNKFYRVSLTLQ
jgi:hypothetical protein